MTRGLLVYGFLMLATTFVVSAQVYLPRKAYMHLVGRIETNQELTMNLVKVNDSLYADLVYDGTGCNRVVLSGQVKEDGTFLLRDPFCDTGMVFNGHFVTRQSISGIFRNVGGEEGLPFVMVESYPEGSIPLLVYYHEFTHNLVEKQESPKAEISQCLIIPGESSNPVLSDSLRIRMIHSFTGKPDKQKDPDAIIRSVQQTFLTHYLSSNESLYESMPDAGSLNWTLLKYMHILYNDNNLLSYYLLNYAYTGGAHGIETHDFTVVSISTGKTLSPDEIFKPGSEAALTDLLTRKLKAITGISMNEKLSDNGFFVDEVIPNSNFYVTGNGIGFVYNHYEIAPYVNGPTDILLPFEDLQNLLMDSGPASVFLIRH